MHGHADGEPMRAELARGRKRGRKWGRKFPGLMRTPDYVSLQRSSSNAKDDGLDPKYWGPPPTRWQVFTARLWQYWLRVRRRLGNQT